MNFGGTLKMNANEIQIDAAQSAPLRDHTHPTAAELLDDAVMRDSLANHGAESC